MVDLSGHRSGIITEMRRAPTTLDGPITMDTDAVLDFTTADPAVTVPVTLTPA